MKIVPIVCRLVNVSNESNETNQSFLVQKVDELIRVHQNNDIAVAFGIVSARILEAVITNSATAGPPPTSKTLLQVLDACFDTIRSDLGIVFHESDPRNSVVDLVLESYQRAKRAVPEYNTLDDFLLQLSHEKMKDQSNDPFYDFAARNCALPGSFMGPMYLLYKIAMSAETQMVVDDGAYMAAIRENILAAGDTCGRSIFIGAVLGAAMTTSSDTTGTAGTFEAAWKKVHANTRDEILSDATVIANSHQLSVTSSEEDPKVEL
jgi:ADP-ribosylglycohydrolase